MTMDDRSRQVLFAIIESYINSPGPVGSRAVTKKYSFGLSPATIRNIMSDLEDLGFLKQPHTSAGRVPTDSGYRFYVDSLKAANPENAHELENQLNKKIEMVRRDINSFLSDASKMLSSLSHYIGITMAPGAETTTLRRLELIKYRRDELAVILLTGEGLVKNKVVFIDPSVSQQDLQRMAAYINTEFAGHTLDDVRRTVASELCRERAQCDSLIRDAIMICRTVFSPAPGDVFISGLAEMLALPDFGDIARIKELLKTIEDKQIVMRLLEKIANAEGTQVLIGSENLLDEMKQFSLVASTYREGSRPIGVVGVIGPTRMNYEQAISLVNLTAKFITDMLSYRQEDTE